MKGIIRIAIILMAIIGIIHLLSWIFLGREHEEIIAKSDYEICVNEATMKWSVHHNDGIYKFDRQECREIYSSRLEK
jgi:hypothetical protein